MRVVYSVKKAAWTTGLACLAVFFADPAQAGINFTSGKVYIQQKVYDKACRFLELARREEPKNPEVYALLAFARAQQRQYASAGAAFQIGIQLFSEKGDKKKIQDLERNRLAVNALLYNAGIGAMNKAGGIAFDDERTSGDPGTPQGKIEKQYGPPGEYSRFTEAGRVQEFWYYPDSAIAFHFMPNSEEPTEIAYQRYEGFGDPQKAITDTTVFSPYAGGSYLAEAAYNFELASYVDPTSLETYQNLSFVMSKLGRTDDSMRAARRGLDLKPDDARLHQNLRAAAMARGNRLFSAGDYPGAVRAYRQAMQVDPASSLGYISRIADAWYKHAGPLPKGTERNAAYDSAASAYQQVLDLTPSDSAAVRQNALYNAAVIYANLDDYPKAIEVLDKATGLYPDNLELWTLSGQTKYQANDFSGTVTALRRALELDPTDPVTHQFLFLGLNRLGKKEESVAEYVLYKSLSQGTKKTALKMWVDSADNRLGAGNKLKPTLAAEGYPEEVYTYSEGDKTFETWFYWSKGKSVTFMEGQVFSKGTFPPRKSE